MSKMLLALAFLFSVLLNGPVFAGDDAVLAKIGDRKITMEEFNRFTSFYNPEKQKLLEKNPQYKSTLLRRLVQGIVLAAIARENGFDKKEDVREQLEVLSNDFLATEYLKREVVDKIEVTEEDVRLYYKMHQEEFKTPEMVRARHILIKVDKSASGEQKEKAREKAEDILKRVKAGEDFAKLASEFSDDDGSKAKGGDLGFFPKGKMVTDFEKLVFSLNEGEVSDVVVTPFGFHIIRVEEKKAPAIEPYDKVKDKIREKVFAEFKNAKVDEFVSNAMEKAGVEMNLDAFSPKK